MAVCPVHGHLGEVQSCPKCDQAVDVSTGGTIAGLYPAGSTGGVGHMLAASSPNCPNCGAPPSEHRVENYDPVFQDGDVVCKCGTRVRGYDAG